MQGTKREKKGEKERGERIAIATIVHARYQEREEGSEREGRERGKREKNEKQQRGAPCDQAKGGPCD